jgi:serine/threonine-protein kinase RsbW
MTAVTVHEVLDSTLEAVGHVETVAVEIARRVGFRGVSLDHISLATHETTTNAVVHGNRYRREKKVFVAISITQDRFKIKIADEGDGFDPMALPDPLAPERLSGDSGRGVYLSRAFMDEYHVRSRDAGGTEVTLVKYRRPGPKSVR